MKNQILHGDCLDLLTQIPDQSIQLICIDPPYGITACKWDTVIPMEKLWPHFNRVIKDSGTIIIFGNEPFSSHVRLSNKNYKYDWYWDKVRPSGFQCARYRPMSRCENIMVFGTGKTQLYTPIMELRDKPVKGKIYGEISPSSNMTSKRDNKVRTYTHKYPQSIIKFMKDKEQAHPTAKPVKLLEYLIGNYTGEGDAVLDCFAGSGSTGLAAKNLDREFILIEKEQEYYDICVNRLSPDNQET